MHIIYSHASSTLNIFFCVPLLSNFFLSSRFTDDSDVRRAHRAVQNAAGGEQQPTRRPRLWTNVSGRVRALACRGRAFIFNPNIHPIHRLVADVSCFVLSVLGFSRVDALIVLTLVLVCQQPWWTAGASLLTGEERKCTMKLGSHYQPCGKQLEIKRVWSLFASWAWSKTGSGTSGAASVAEPQISRLLKHVQYNHIILNSVSYNVDTKTFWTYKSSWIRSSVSSQWFVLWFFFSG